MKKKIVILDNIGGGRLANQLWNYMAWYAYVLEKNIKLENYAFFDYAKFFNIPAPKNIFINLAFFILNKIKVYRDLRLYDNFIAYIHNNFKAQVVEDDRVNTIYLLPTPNKKDPTAILHKLETLKGKIYISGWLFRNPDGLIKYRTRILEYFKPKREIIEKVDSFVSSIREKYKHIFGVHIRQTDYKKWQNGKYYFSPEEVNKIMNNFLLEYKIKPSDSAFVICSDDKIDYQIFKDLNIFFPKGNMVEDMLTLSKTDLILGNDSTFGAFASYYGNIPFIVFERNGIEWNYYRDKDGYFENKKNTLTQY